jgi:archaemetzincin
MMALDSVKTEMLEHTTKNLAPLFPFDFRIIDRQQSLDFAYEARRDQYYAHKILSYLLGEIPSDAEKMLGVTGVDLCTPIFSFVYGMAQLGGQVAVISTHRLRPEFYRLPQNKELLEMRLIKECVHELGHCFTLVHCRNPLCVMYLSDRLPNIDCKDKEFCKSCNEYLKGKLEEANHA